MRFIIFLIGILVTINTNAQDPLSFSVLGFDPAKCRTAGDQYGNGTVYAAATGGTPAYEYLWTNLVTGATTAATTWGLLNVGEYKIQVTDALGDFIVDTIRVDSINPIASMSIIGAVDGGPDYYTGDAPLEITFENNSENVMDAVFPDVTPRYYFRPTELEPFSTSTSIWTDFEYIYNYEGIYMATLIAVNKNGCADTTQVNIKIIGNVTIEEDFNWEDIEVYSVAENTIQISIKNQNNIPILFNLYALNGALIRTVEINEEITVLENRALEGIYLYEFSNSANNGIIKRGKIKL